MGLQKLHKSRFSVARVGGHGALPGHVAELAVSGREGLILLSKAEKNISLWGKTFSLIFDTWSGTAGIYFPQHLGRRGRTSQGARRNPSLAHQHARLRTGHSALLGAGGVSQRAHLLGGTGFAEGYLLSSRQAMLLACYLSACDSGQVGSSAGHPGAAGRYFIDKDQAITQLE